MTVDLTVGPRFEDDLAHRHGAQAKGAETADRRLFEQERRAARGNQVEKALMNLDREVGAVEMRLHGLRDPIQGFGHGAALERADLTPRDQAEPLRPRRRQLGQQGGAELLDRVQRRAVEQTVDRAVAGTEFRAEAGAALRQRMEVALPPQTFPAAPALLGPLVARPDGIEREITHEVFSAGSATTRLAARPVLLGRKRDLLG